MNQVKKVAAAATATSAGVATMLGLAATGGSMAGASSSVTESLPTVTNAENVQPLFLDSVFHDVTDGVSTAAAVAAAYYAYKASKVPADK